MNKNILTCPHCNSKIFLNPDIKYSKNEIERMVYERTENMTGVLIKYKKENRELKKRLEDISKIN